jgi:hypothetical protein
MSTIYTDKEIDESPLWADYMDIGSFLWDSAFSVDTDEMDIPSLSDNEYFVLGHYFTETVFGGNLGEAYKYAFNLIPYDFHQKLNK